MPETEGDTVNRFTSQQGLDVLKENIRRDLDIVSSVRSGEIADTDPTAQAKLIVSVLNLCKFVEARVGILSLEHDLDQEGLSIEKLKEIFEVYLLAGEVMQALANLDASRFIAQIGGLRWARSALENAVKDLPKKIQNAVQLFKQDLGFPKNY